MRFANCTALVTGANSGIGLATTQRLLKEGAKVLAVDLDTTQLRDLPLSWLEVDLGLQDAPSRIVAAAEQKLGTIDFLINNAGIGGSRTLELSDDDFIDRVLNINLRSVMRLTRDLLPLLRKPGASIVNVGSVYGETGFPGSAPYAASKGAITQLTRQLAADLGPDGIRVNAVAPGVIRTAMTARRLDTDASYWASMVETTPLGKVGTAEQVAAVITFLCSQDASFVLGQTIAVDGGWLTCRTRSTLNA